MNIRGLLKNYIFPVVVLSSGIVGVGIFSLPYITQKVGVWLMFGYFVFLTFIVASVHVIFSQVCLKTPDFKRFPGFVRFHFGNLAGFFYLFSTMFGYYGILLVYLIVGSGFLGNIFSSGQNPIFWAFVFWLPVCLLVYFGIKTISRAEFFVMAMLIFTLALIFISGFSQIKISNLSASNFNFQNLFLPYGAIIFSLWGTGLIPEVEEMLQNNKKNLKFVAATSVLFVAAIYLFFIFLILGITGPAVTEAALTGLKFFLSPLVSRAALFLGVTTTFAASVTLGLTLKKVFMYDLGIKSRHAWIFACLVPVILFLAGFRSFVPLISFVGGVLLGIDGIFILLMYKKIGGRKAVIYPLILVFLAGIVYEIIYFIK